MLRLHSTYSVYRLLRQQPTNSLHPAAGVAEIRSFGKQMKHVTWLADHILLAFLRHGVCHSNVAALGGRRQYSGNVHEDGGGVQPQDRRGRHRSANPRERDDTTLQFFLLTASLVTGNHVSHKLRKWRRKMLLKMLLLKKTQLRKILSSQSTKWRQKLLMVR